MGEHAEHCACALPPSAYHTDSADCIPSHTRAKGKITFVHIHLEIMKRETLNRREIKHLETKGV